MDKVTASAQKFEALIRDQLARVERMKTAEERPDYQNLPQIIIGTVGGDGIGPAITAQAQRVIEYLLADEIAAGKVKIKEIAGLTIENRVKVGKAIPDDILEELKQCHVILKGPTTTPQAGDKWPYIKSANVAIRKELDRFANVRPGHGT